MEIKERRLTDTRTKQDTSFLAYLVCTQIQMDQLEVVLQFVKDNVRKQKHNEIDNEKTSILFRI